MYRNLTIGIVLLLACALVPGLGETVENAVHLVSEGHLAHGTPDGDHHDEPGTEHDCSGTLHLCSCCVSSNLAQAKPPGKLPQPESDRFVAPDLLYAATASSQRVYHPPRA